jgi:uncharacterized membrane protein
MTDDAPSDASAPSAALDPPAASPADASTPAASPPGAGFFERLPWWTVPALLIGIPVLFAIIARIVPGFYDHVVWPYYWGPIKADAMNCAFLSDLHPNECASSSSAGILAHSGYNVVNTLTWAALLGVCILGLAQMLNAFGTPMDDKLILGATAWVVVGSVTHVLEDTGLLLPPLQYFFITPPIYLVFGAFGVTSFLVGQWMRRVAERSGLHAALRLLWVLHIVLVLLWTALWLKGWGQVAHYVNPVWVAAFAGVDFLVARAIVLRQGKVDPSLMTSVLSLGTYLLVGAYIVTYLRHPWSTAPGDGMPYAFVFAPVLAAVVAALVWLAARTVPKVLLAIDLVGFAALVGLVVVVVALRLDSTLDLGLGWLHGAVAIALLLVVAAAVATRAVLKLRGGIPALTTQAAWAYALAINVLLVFSQMLDGFATALGIDLRGYTEKHVLSAGVIDGFRSFAESIHWGFGAHYPTFLGFAPIKLVVSLLVIYAIDVHSQEDARRHPTLIGLVKFAIIMVGIGPGVRDFTRLSLGV